MTEVVLDMVSLILQGIEGLVLDLPARPGQRGPTRRHCLAHVKVADPTVVVGAPLANVQPIFEEIQRHEQCSNPITVTKDESIQKNGPSIHLA